MYVATKKRRRMPRDQAVLRRLEEIELDWVNDCTVSKRDKDWLLRIWKEYNC